jgi:metacaspase-1
MAVGVSVHIGLNAVNPRHYMGWPGNLVACENDARDMAAVAASLGYAKSTVLLTKAATSRRVMAAIEAAAAGMWPGDAFLLTYSGHGGQVTDSNGDEAERDYGESGEVGDAKDETWCLYDRQLIDDEMWALWAVFPARSRVFVVSDSCHSGTVTRDVPDFDLLAAGAAAAGAAAAGARAPAERGMPPDVAREVQQARAATYARIQSEVPPREASRIRATVALVSGCQDNQTSLDGDRNGLFTEKLLQVWDGGAFAGSLHDLRNLTARQLPATQTPNYYVVGRPNARALRRPALRV